MAIIKDQIPGRKRFIHPETAQMLPEIKKTLEVFQQGNEIVEIRILNAGANRNTVLSSYFTLDGSTLDKVINEIDRQGLYKYSIYMTLNRINPDVSQGKAINAIRSARSTTRDKDIASFRFIHVDLDPEREAKTQATAEEMKHAEDLMYQIKTFLSEQGFSEPILSFSGNGYNLDYKIDLPNTKENTQLIKDVLTVLSAKFSNENVKVDTSTYNAARIIKLYGCLSCKGENTPERPYRQSRILSVPDTISITGKDVIEKFLTVEAQSSAPKLKQQSASQSKLIKDDSGRKIAHIRDVPKWLQSYNLGYKIKEDDEYTLYSLDVCPFNSEHINGSSFVQVFDNGNVYFRCHHDHCAGYTIHDMLKTFPDKTRQLPVLEGTDNIIVLFNRVGDLVELISDINNVKYLKYEDQVIPLESERTADIITTIAQSINQLPTINTVNRIINNIRSCYASIPLQDSKYVGNRILMVDNCLLYACRHNKIFMIKDGTVDVYTGNRVYFVSVRGAISQCTPNLSVRPEALPDLVRSIFNVNEKSLLRFIAQLICFFVPNVNTPILILGGAQGTSKTTTARKIKALVDPCKPDVVATPDREDGLTAILASNYLTVFDNAERLNARFSDLLAISVTGGSTTRRKLYTDNDVNAVNLKSKIIINGIGDIVIKSDLSERCNTIYLEPIRVRKTDAVVESEFKKIKPNLLGAIFNTLGKGFTYVNQMAEKYTGRLPRMADFCVYGAAFIKAVGLSDEEFVVDYTRSINESVSECNETDPFNMIIKSFLSSVEGCRWRGGAQDLLALLQLYAKNNRMKLDEHLSASSLSRKLGQNQAALKSIGIIFNRDKNGTERVIELLLSSETVCSPTNTRSPEFKGRRIVPKKEIPKSEIEDDQEEW